MHAVVLILILLAATTAGAVEKHSVGDWPDKYDQHFRKYSKHYFGPGFDWQWFKAQAIAESGLKSKARSKAGARGLMQIMPSTYREIQEDNPHMKDIDSPRWNIAAGIYYDRILYKRWKSPPAGNERLYFAFGSYNAGYTRIKNTFQKVAPPAATWEHVEHFVPGQTRHYVRRIRGLMNRKASKTP
ncbi:MAG: transglycosylase SLT domain-containing protein [Pseudomonadota bacterium]